MINYLEPENPQCTTRHDFEVAQKVAHHLGIKDFLSFDFRHAYQERIIDYIYTSYQNGITPNPDVFCNNLIKFDLFLNEALLLGCDSVATGHYAQIKTIDNATKLFCGIDGHKDQSYFLARLNQFQLDHALSPLGRYTKQEVRTIAQKI